MFEIFGCLFENFVRGVGVFFVVFDNGFFLGLLSIYVFVVFGFGGVEFGEFVVFIIGSDVKDGDVVVIVDDESIFDDGVVVGVVDGGVVEEVFVGSFEVGVKVIDEVVGYES